MRLSAVYCYVLFSRSTGERSLACKQTATVQPATSAFVAGWRVVEMYFPPSETPLEIRFHFKNSQKPIDICENGNVDDVTKSNRKIVSNDKNA